MLNDNLKRVQWHNLLVHLNLLKGIVEREEGLWRAEEILIRLLKIPQRNTELTKHSGKI